MKFAMANFPAPLLNRPDFFKVFKDPLGLDAQERLMAVETVLLPEMTVSLEQEVENNIFQVALDGYPNSLLYADMRMLKLCTAPAEKDFSFPSKEKILKSLRSMLGSTYIWGGNWSRGIPELLELYPPQKPLDAASKKRWTLEGVDCSGLLYEACCGYTPRNTSQLVFFGRELKKDEKLSSLDLIVWNGHVVIVYDETKTIESSCSAGGVIFRDLFERLEEVRNERGSSFSLRRWHPQASKEG